MTDVLTIARRRGAAPRRPPTSSRRCSRPPSPRCWRSPPAALGWRGSDLPAHFFRVAIVKRDGFEIWNNLWYGGHHTLGYGILFPLLGAALGIWTVAVLSAAASAFLADVLLRRATGRRCLLASMWFAVGTVTNVAVGRLPFALGLAVALGALVAAQARRMVSRRCSRSPPPRPARSSARSSPSCSWRGRGRRSGVDAPPLRRRSSATSIAPVLLIAVFYPQGGAFPFRWPALLLAVGVLAWVLVFVPVEQRLVRAAAVLYALAAVVAFVVPTPLGANLNRFGHVRRRAGPARRRPAPPDAGPGDPVAAVVAVVAGARRHGAGRVGTPRRRRPTTGR